MGALTNSDDSGASQTALLDRNKAGPSRARDSGHAAGNAELPVDASEVSCYRSLGKAEALTDLAGGHALARNGKDLALPLTQHWFGIPLAL